jgi:hypothetical protein
MSKAATILVLGDPGPFRKELLTHHELEVIWVSAPPEAAQLLAAGEPDACIVSPEFERSPALKSVFRAAGARTPLILLSASSAPRLPLDAEAVWVVEVAEVESLVAILAEVTGIRFARYPRADVVLPVVVELDGRRTRAETIDVSLCGVAVRGFPPAPVGSTVRLELEVLGRILHLTGRVVRWFEDQGRRAAGVTLVDLGEGPRHMLADAIERALRWKRDQYLLTADLFDDVPVEPAEPSQPLDALELEGARGQDDAHAFGPEREDLGRLLAGEITAAGLPGWLVLVAGALTDLEVAAATGRDAPAWAHRSVDLRLTLALVRASTRDTPLPSSLLDAAYRLFLTLRDEGAGQSVEVVRQIGKVRAALLRELVSRAGPRRGLPAPRSRSGRFAAHADVVAR